MPLLRQYFQLIHHIVTCANTFVLRSHIEAHRCELVYVIDGNKCGKFQFPGKRTSKLNPTACRYVREGAGRMKSILLMKTTHTTSCTKLFPKLSKKQFILNGRHQVRRVSARTRVHWSRRITRARNVLIFDNIIDDYDDTDEGDDDDETENDQSAQLSLSLQCTRPRQTFHEQRSLFKIITK